MGPMTLPLLLALLLACDGGSNCADVSDPVLRSDQWRRVRMPTGS